MHPSGIRPYHRVRTAIVAGTRSPLPNVTYPPHQRRHRRAWVIDEVGVQYLPAVIGVEPPRRVITMEGDQLEMAPR